MEESLSSLEKRGGVFFTEHPVRPFKYEDLALAPPSNMKT
jgi:hypothetical protein